MQVDLWKSHAMEDADLKTSSTLCLDEILELTQKYRSASVFERQGRIFLYVARQVRRGFRRFEAINLKLALAILIIQSALTRMVLNGSLGVIPFYFFKAEGSRRLIMNEDGTLEPTRPKRTITIKPRDDENGQRLCIRFVT